MANKVLSSARNSKNDEFYTSDEDVEHELSHYVHSFQKKIVFCNANDSQDSAFVRYFIQNFNALGLRRLISISFCPQIDLFSTCVAKRIIYEGSQVEVQELKGDGDFRSAESLYSLQESDIVVTNPPFSLFGEFVSLMMSFNKKFIVLGNQNAITYKKVFPLLKDNRIWLGHHFGEMKFKIPYNSEPKETRFWEDAAGQKWRSLGNVCWYTNIDIIKRHERLRLQKKYSPEHYPKFDNFDAINVDRVNDIPCDYEGNRVER